MGPLAGFRIVEFAGIGPAPMASMLFADLGAAVIRIDRLTPSGLGVDMPAQFGLLARSRPSVAIDMKHPEGMALALDLVDKADALIEGFRPGTMERLGLGPDVALKRNPRLVYGRMTGWGQTGPLAQAAGHDLNYLALTGGARRHRPQRIETDAAAQPGRRFRRRRALSRVRRRLRDARSAALGQGPSRRCGDDRRRRIADDDVLWPLRRRPAASRARHQPPRQRIGDLRHLRMRRR